MDKDYARNKSATLRRDVTEAVLYNESLPCFNKEEVNEANYGRPKR